jgi:hypothetical protein
MMEGGWSFNKEEDDKFRVEEFSNNSSDKDSDKDSENIDEDI